MTHAKLHSPASPGAGFKTPAGASRPRAFPHFAERMRQAHGGESSGPDASQWEIKDFLTFRINILYRLLDRQLKKMLADHHHLSIAEWRVLGQLATNSPTTVREVAATTYMAKSQISRAARCLVRSGYVLRGKDAEDDRSAVFAITREGQRKYKTVMRMNQERQRRLLSQLEPSERRVMFEATEKLIEFVRREL
jgi:DNA-binding MarR family transcriptional regulator